MSRHLSDDQRQFLALFPDDGTAIGGYALMAQLQDAGWRTREIEHVIGELRELGEIIVGRGSSSGSLRHVRNDRSALLDAIDELEADGKPCTRATLEPYMEWHADYLEQVLDALHEAGRIAVEPGRKGIITRAEYHVDEPEDIEGTPVVLPDPAVDERQLLELVPEDGAIGNTRLRNALVHRHGWDDERFWEIRKRLRQRGLIEVGRGRGDSLRRVSIDAVVLAPEPPALVEPRPAEELRDEEMIWRKMPDNGDEVLLSALQSQFDWPAPRFFAALDQMVAEQRIHWHNSKLKRLVQQPPPPPPPPPPFFVALQQFVRNRFDTSSLRLFVANYLNAESITQSVAWEKDYRDVTHSVCSQLRMSGYIDAEFFVQLRAHFSRLHSKIEALEILWRNSDPQDD